MTRPIAKHSTTGIETTWTKKDGRVEREFEHITCEPTKDLISSCTGCGRSNYVGGCFDGDRPIEPSGLQLHDITFCAHGRQSSMSIRLCPDCIKDLRSKVFQASA